MRSGVRTCPRTPGCKSYQLETIRKFNISNFITHLERCDKLPSTESWEQWKSRQNSAPAAGGAAREDAELNHGAAAAQRNVLQEFVQRGIESPHQEVTRRSFRMEFVKAVTIP